MPMVEQNNDTEIGSPPPQPAFEQQQRRRMLIALAVLLIALISVLIKDRQFWFPSSSSSESETPDQTFPAPANPASTPTKSGAPAAPPKAVRPAPAHTKPKSKQVGATVPSADTLAGMSPIVTNRKILPPLQVEVVAGNQHRPVSPGDSSVKLEMQSSAVDSESTDASPKRQQSAFGVSNAVAQVQLSPGTAEVVSRPVDPTYPLLAKQMKVQGAVVLQALISKTGSIQDIQILSGPAILSAAAREAVKQWHFKPYYQSGQAVETEARITVNFTISTD